MTYVNPLVESGEYERVYAGDIEPGAVLAAYDDAEVVKVHPYAERVSFSLTGGGAIRRTLGMVNYHRGTVLLVKVGSQA